MSSAPGNDAGSGAMSGASTRNVVLVGHSGAGKTTLVEALLVAAGDLQRPGAVTDGTTVSDHDEAEVRQQRSVSLAVAPLEHDGIKVNLLDTPGYADFVGELRAGLRAADAALFVVSRRRRRRRRDPACCGRSAPPSACRARSSITQLDHQRADFDETVALLPAASSATTCCRSTCRCTATTAAPSPA